MSKDPDKLERIRVRAYHIWEQLGRPEGGHELHWEQAEREEEQASLAGRTAKASRPTPATAKKAPAAAKAPKPLAAKPKKPTVK